MSRLVGLAGTVGKVVSASKLNTNGALAYAKWDTYARFNGAGVEATAATIEQQATGLLFTVNGAAEVAIGTYTGATGAANEIVYADPTIATVRGLLDAINGIAPGQPGPTDPAYNIRWRAGLGDWRPGTPIGATAGLAIAAANAMLGRTEKGMLIFGNGPGLVPATKFSVGLGTPGALEGGGQLFADQFQSEYQSDTSGNRFRVRAQRRAVEEQPGEARYQIRITEIRADMSFAGADNVVTVYDDQDNVVASFPVGASTGKVPQVSKDNPVYIPIGSAAFVEAEGTGAITSGPLTVVGEIRIA